MPRPRNESVRPAGTLLKHLPSTGLLDMTIIVVSWNTRELLARCLASVFSSITSSTTAFEGHIAPLTGEVIVIDNGSSDGSIEMVREKYPQAHLFTSKNNVGFARANNVALRECRGRYALLLNPDTEVLAGGLDTLVSFMDQHPEAGAAGPTVLNPDGTLQQSCHRSPELTREIWRLLHGDAIYPFGVYAMDRWSRAEPRTVDVIQGACLILRRETLNQVGILDETFYIYSEETDLCERIRQNNWKIYWVPLAQIIHYGGQSTHQVAEEMFLQLYYSKILYFRKHKGSKAASAYKIVLLLASLIRITMFRITIGSLARRQSGVKQREYQVLACYYRRLISELPRM